MASLKLDDQLCFSIYAAGHAFNRFYKPLLTPLGLTYPQYLVLLTLWEEDGLPLRSIGERLTLDSGTLTPLLRRMEQSGLVTRERDDVDERLVRIRLTAKAKKLRSKAEAFPSYITTASHCSASELNALRKVILGLAEDLDAAAA